MMRQHYVHYRPYVYSGPSEGNLIVLNASFGLRSECTVDHVFIIVINLFFVITSSSLLELSDRF